MLARVERNDHPEKIAALHSFTFPLKQYLGQKMQFFQSYQTLQLLVTTKVVSNSTYDDDRCIQSKRWQVIFQAKAGKR